MDSENTEFTFMLRKTGICKDISKESTNEFQDQNVGLEIVAMSHSKDGTESNEIAPIDEYLIGKNHSEFGSVPYLLVINKVMMDETEINSIPNNQLHTYDIKTFLSFIKGIFPPNKRKLFENIYRSTIFNNNCIENSPQELTDKASFRYSSEMPYSSESKNDEGIVEKADNCFSFSKSDSSLITKKCSKVKATYITEYCKDNAIERFITKDQQQEKAHSSENKAILSKRIHSDRIENVDSVNIKYDDCNVDLKAKPSFMKGKTPKKLCNCALEVSKQTICNSCQTEDSVLEIVNNDKLEVEGIPSEIQHFLDGAENDEISYVENESSTLNVKQKPSLNEKRLFKYEAIVPEITVMSYLIDGTENDDNGFEETWIRDQSPKQKPSPNKRKQLKKQPGCIVEASKDAIFDKTMEEVASNDSDSNYEDIFSEIEEMQISLECGNINYGVEGEADYFYAKTDVGSIENCSICSIEADTGEFYNGTSVENSTHGNALQIPPEFRGLAKTILSLMAGFCIGLFIGLAHSYTDVSMSDLYCAVYFIIYLILYLIFF